MSKNEITVNVNAKLCVDDETAAAALTLVKIYLNSRPVKLVQTRKETGEMELNYEPA